jgi:RNA polymerase subunit RPABC4/transcription elongation factor Spt4
MPQGDLPPAPLPGTPPDWYVDPTNHDLARYWNGQAWSIETYPAPTRAQWAGAWAVADAVDREGVEPERPAKPPHGPPPGRHQDQVDSMALGWWDGKGRTEHTESKPPEIEVGQKSSASTHEGGSALAGATAVAAQHVVATEPLTAFASAAGSLSMDRRFCSQCGGPLASTDPFCPSCGEARDFGPDAPYQSSVSKTRPQLYCMGCGRGLPVDSHACSICGTPTLD